MGLPPVNWDLNGSKSRTGTPAQLQKVIEYMIGFVVGDRTWKTLGNTVSSFVFDAVNLKNAYLAKIPSLQKQVA